MINAPKGPILLVVPPFHSTTRPALGVSQLKANMEAEGFRTEILYLNLLFAERIGPYVDHWIASGTTDVMLGEFIFSHLLFDGSESTIEKYVQEVLWGSDVGKQLSQMFPGQSLFETVHSLIRKADDFFQNIAIEEILSRHPWLVGMTSTFQQNCASLLLIKMIKKKRPEIISVMGGANCESTMGEELFVRFSEVDYIGQGECDHSFVELIRSIQNGNDRRPIPGILSRLHGQQSLPPRHLQSDDLERLPYPDFSDYFGQLLKSSFKDSIIPGLVMETSRGCWWGAKSQCSFCGMNGENMHYRSKSGARALQEMTALVNQYNIPRIYVADNVLDMKYFKSVLPQLTEHTVAELFYETKANLTKKQIQMLAQANIKWIQPGIESLSDQTLKYMHKGANALKSIELLKRGAEYGIRVTWNHLFGVPGEREDEIPEIAQIIQAIHHLEPPSAVGVIDMVRFSPYFMSPEKYGLEPNYPAKYYSYIYPFSIESLKRLAYFYQTDFFSNKSKSDAYHNLKKIVAGWKREHHRSHLIAIPRKKSLIVIDTRACSQRLWFRLTGMSRKAYELCDKACSLPSILEALGPEVSSYEVQIILQSLVNDKLMLNVNGRYLSLATDPRHSYKKFISVFPGGKLRELKSLQQLARYCLSIMSFTVSFKDIFNAGRKKTSKVLSALTTNILLKLIFFLTNLMSEKESQNEDDELAKSQVSQSK